MNPEQIAKLADVGLERDSIQHAYIPPRIWQYQNLRLKECLADFLAAQSKIEACLKHVYCLYLENYGSAEAVFAPNRKSTKAPFSSPEAPKVHSCVLSDVLDEFGVHDVISKWVETSTIHCLSTYLSLIPTAGAMYIANFSLMRKSEVATLPYDCWRVDKDQLGDEVCLIGSATTKTQDDDEALWVVSPSCKLAVDAMRSIRQLRIWFNNQNPHRNSFGNPGSGFLIGPASEPWAGARSTIDKGVNMRAISDIQAAFPKLFDQNQLTITGEDDRIARTVNERMKKGFEIGMPWPLSWHQLRRTGAVNMMSSGLIEEQDLTYQLKHTNRLMSRYYANNYRHLQAALNTDARGVYLQEAYLVLGLKAAKLLNANWVSPHSEKRKLQLVEVISEAQHQAQIMLAKQGKLSYHETFLGGCTKPGEPCPLGGISNVTSCLGFDEKRACEFALVNKANLPIIAELSDVIRRQMIDVAEHSPLYQSLDANKQSLDRALEIANG